MKAVNFHETSLHIYQSKLRRITEESIFFEMCIYAFCWVLE